MLAYAHSDTHKNQSSLNFYGNSHKFTALNSGAKHSASKVYGKALQRWQNCTYNHTEQQRKKDVGLWPVHFPWARSMVVDR